jgi:hypothetical protein
MVAGGMILTLALSLPAGIVSQSPAAAPDQRSAPSSQPAPTIVEVSQGDGFHWGSAAIGGAATLGLGVASLGCVLLARQSHHERSGTCDRPSRASRRSSPISQGGDEELEIDAKELSPPRKQHREQEER